MVHVTFKELVAKYGPYTASGLLASLEQWANVSVDPAKVDEEKRLKSALENLSSRSPTL